MLIVNESLPPPVVYPIERCGRRQLTIRESTDVPLRDILFLSWEGNQSNESNASGRIEFSPLAYPMKLAALPTVTLGLLAITRATNNRKGVEAEARAVKGASIERK